MPRLKTQSNLRQNYRELVERANAIDIESNLVRGYLLINDPISEPGKIVERKVWADEKNLRRFRHIVEIAEQINKERSETIYLLNESRAVLDAFGVKLGELDEKAWWFRYGQGQPTEYSPLLKSGWQELLIRARGNYTFGIH